MRTTRGFFSEGLVGQEIPTSAHQIRAFPVSCRHPVLWPIVTLLLAACIGGLLLPAATAQDFTPAVQNDPQRAAAALLSGLCGDQSLAPGVQQDLGQRACNLQSAPSAQWPPPLQAMAWEEVATQGTFSVEVSNQQFINLAGRLRALRLGATGFDVRGLAFNLDDKVLPASRLLASAGGAGVAGEPPAVKRLGAFLSGTLSFGDKDATSTEDGFDFDTVGITGGIDYGFTDNFILGLALGYTSLDADLEADDDEVEADGYSASLYSTYYLGDLFFDFTASAGMADYKMRRNIRYVTMTDSVDKTASSDTDGAHYTLALGVGYEFRVAGAVFSPYAQLNYLKADIDRFREGGADEFNLEIGDQKVTSLLSALGGQLSYPIRGAFGTLSPQLRLDWRHEFENNRRSLTARFINDPSGRVAVIRSDDPDRNYFNLAAGVVAALVGGATVGLEYETVLGLKDITNHIVRARLRVSF
jgi:outer membrane lipase/esterase